jgi:hypothetical protein
MCREKLNFAVDREFVQRLLATGRAFDLDRGVLLHRPARPDKPLSGSPSPTGLSAEETTMPRGIKGSGKSRKPGGEPVPLRRRGRKPMVPFSDAVQPVESPAAEDQPAGLPATEEPAGPLPGEVPPPARELPDEVQVLGVQALRAQPPELAAAETELARKYPHIRIKPGSLRLGAAEGFGNKRIVTIVCGACQVNERVVATSDLFHVSRCEECSQAAKKAARNAKKQSRPN